ncbi:hypothetical protein CB1_002263015 [Camelus ferus]|nr:hypothetical protein CB1_002263015 [Camelus ferus]
MVLQNSSFSFMTVPTKAILPHIATRRSALRLGAEEVLCDALPVSNSLLSPQQASTFQKPAYRGYRLVSEESHVLAGFHMSFHPIVICRINEHLTDEKQTLVGDKAEWSDKFIKLTWIVKEIHDIYIGLQLICLHTIRAMQRDLECSDGTIKKHPQTHFSKDTLAISKRGDRNLKVSNRTKQQDKDIIMHVWKEDAVGKLS